MQWLVCKVLFSYRTLFFCNNLNNLIILLFNSSSWPGKSSMREIEQLVVAPECMHT